MIYYKTTKYNDKIELVEATRVTDKCIFMKNEMTGKEERSNINSEYCCFHKSKKEAFNFLIENLTKNIEMLNGKLEYENNRLRGINAKYPEFAEVNN